MLLTFGKFKRFAAFALVALLLPALEASPQDAGFDPEAEEFIQFFKDVYTDGKEVAGPIIGPWPTPLPACIFGKPSELSKRRITLLFSFVRFTSRLYVEPHFEEKPSECPQDTLLYARIHSGEANIQDLVTHDVNYIGHVRGVQDPQDFTFSRYGMGARFTKNGRVPLFSYVAIDQFDRRETDYDDTIANNVIQQEIIQSILFAGDMENTKNIASIINETHDDIATGDSGGEPKYRKKWTEKNVLNLCVYDVVLLGLLYSDATYDSNGSLSFYKKYIRENFQNIKKNALEKLSDKDFSEIFPQRC